METYQAARLDTLLAERKVDVMVHCEVVSKVALMDAMSAAEWDNGTDNELIELWDNQLVAWKAVK